MKFYPEVKEQSSWKESFRIAEIRAKERVGKKQQQKTQDDGMDDEKSKRNVMNVQEVKVVSFTKEPLARKRHFLLITFLFYKI